MKLLIFHISKNSSVFLRSVYQTVVKNIISHFLQEVRQIRMKECLILISCIFLIQGLSQACHGERQVRSCLGNFAF